MSKGLTKMDYTMCQVYKKLCTYDGVYLVGIDIFMRYKDIKFKFRKENNEEFITFATKNIIK